MNYKVLVLSCIFGSMVLQGKGFAFTYHKQVTQKQQTHIEKLVKKYKTDQEKDEARERLQNSILEKSKLLAKTAEEREVVLEKQRAQENARNEAKREDKEEHRKSLDLRKEKYAYRKLYQPSQHQAYLDQLKVHNHKRDKAERNKAYRENKNEGNLAKVEPKVRKKKQHSVGVGSGQTVPQEQKSNTLDPDLFADFNSSVLTCDPLYFGTISHQFHQTQSAILNGLLGVNPDELFNDQGWYQGKSN